MDGRDWKPPVCCALVVASAGCAKEPLPLEEAAGRFREEKATCEVLPGSSYEASSAYSETLSVGVFDCGFALPSAVSISHDGRFMFVGQLQGRVYVYQKHTDHFEREPALFYDLGELGVHDEAGLTGVALAPAFDIDSEEPEQRDVFLAFQANWDGKARNRIRRLTARLDDGKLIGTDPVDIFSPNEASAQAHQIHQPVVFEFAGETHLIAPVGDAKHGASRDDPATTNGSLVMLKRSGEPPDGQRPWSENPLVQAVGLRNVYGIELLPEAVDPRRGLLGMENGDEASDRGWYAHVLPIEGAGRIQTDLGASDDQSWGNVDDLALPASNPRPRNIVFHLYEPTVAPTAVSLHPGTADGRTIPPPGLGHASFVAAFFGRSHTKDLGPGKNIQLVELENLTTGDLRARVAPLVQRRRDTFGLFRHPVGLDVDPERGDIYFSDIITGELYRVVVEGS